MPLDADTAALLANLAALGAPPISTLTPTEARQASAARYATRPPGPALARVENRSIPGPAGDIVLRLYARSTAPHQPAVVFFHGGGWVLSDLDGHDPACRALAAEIDAVVVSVDYRLAPEHPFPAAPEDCYAATAWIATHGADFGIDPARLAVAGDSAGGNLAAAVCLMARAEGGPSIAAQALIYPVTDADFTRPSYVENAEGYLLTTASMRWFWDHYVADPAQRGHQLASPLRATSLSDLPPALILTAEFDPLRDEGEAFGRALADAGNEVTVARYHGQIHGFFSQVGIIRRGEEGRRHVASFLARLIG